MKRSELKQLVKECLIEILQEGLGGDNLSSFSKNLVSDSGFQKQTIETKKAKNLQPKPVASSIVYGKKSINENFQKAVPSVVNVLTDNPVLSSIFADTAKTTLQEQYASGHSGRPVIGGGSMNLPSMDNNIPMRGTAEQIAASIDPTEIFSDSAKIWTKLAFAPKR